MARWFVISYDFRGIDYTHLYGKNEPRENMIEFLFRNGIRTMEAYTDSTIHFMGHLEDHVKEYKSLEKELNEKFPTLFYSLNLISSWTATGLPTYVKKYEQPTPEKDGFKVEFDKDVDKIRKALVEANTITL